MNIIIERARPEDARQMLAYLKQIGAESDNLTFGAEGPPFTEVQEEAYLRELANSDRSILYVVKADGNIVANASFSTPPQQRMKHCGELGISVLKDFWGKGIGTLLMEQIIAFAKDTAHAEIIHLEVRSDNAAAIHLYKKFGFIKTGTFPGLLKIDGKLIDFDLMNLYL